IKNSDFSANISNCQTFVSVSTNMRRGEIIRKADKEEKNINELLSKLLEHQHITQDAHDTFVKKYTVFIDKWKEAIRLTLDYPLHADLAEFE
ncbi:hypothetical protein OFN62_31075, partial [Escherichia coli]|nr:hypothetical protein [Escherichia coli]